MVSPDADADTDANDFDGKAIHFVAALATSGERLSDELD